MQAASRYFMLRYRSPDHWIEVFRTYYGPVLKTFAALDVESQASLDADLRVLIDRFNVAEDGTVVVPSEYLEVVVTKAA